MFIIFTLSVTIAPLPKVSNITTQTIALANLTFSCVYNDTKGPCAGHVVQNFGFYTPMFFPRNAPYTQQQYKQLNITSISTINCTILSSSEIINVATVNESYILNVTTNGIIIVSQNSFGLNRALSSLVQLVSNLKQLPEDKQAYSIAIAYVNDSASFPWREVLVDGARHYLSVRVLKKIIDAVSIAKFNVLHLHAVDAQSFPIWFAKTPESNLIKGAYSKYYYYNTTDLMELQAYALMRGVVLYVELDMPGHAASWGYADSGIVAKCPSYSSNINNIPLNPANNVTYDYVKGAISELINQSMFQNGSFTVNPMIHLGGDEIVAGCWSQDAQIKAYMTQHNLTTGQLWKEFQTKVNNIILNLTVNKTTPWKVYWNDAFANGNQFSNQSIIHFWSSTDKTAALNAGLKVIQSTYWYLDQMHPDGSNYYFYQDTWQTFYKVNITQNVTAAHLPQVLGGGAAEWGEYAWGTTVIPHVFPRALAISEVLWSDPKARTVNNEVIQRLEGLSCKLYQAGLMSGAMNPGAPCLGYPEK